MKDLAAARWVLHPDNPVIHPSPPNWLMGDPTVLTPGESPDGQWHLFCNTLRHVQHFIGEDGVAWRLIGNVCRGMRAFVYPEDGVFHLFYELHAATYHRSRICARTSTDLETWSAEREILAPLLAWEGRLPSYTSCPGLVKDGDTYRLYYSAGAIALFDTLVTEPRYIGVAESEHILGPYRRHAVPIIGPDPDHRWRNRGAGSIKLYPKEGGGFWAFNNGIYRGPDGRHGSAIMLLESDDGYRFRQVHEQPIIQPTGEGWLRAFVYAFDLAVFEDETRLYFNARDGWSKGKEYIGFARAQWD